MTDGFKYNLVYYFMKNEQYVRKAMEECKITKPFSYEFVNDDKVCKLQTNVAIPTTAWNVKELCLRILAYHNLPAYLEEGNKIYPIIS